MGLGDKKHLLYKPGDLGSVLELNRRGETQPTPESCPLNPYPKVMMMIKLKTSQAKSTLLGDSSISHVSTSTQDPQNS